MAAFRNFEYILAWQKARHSTQLVYQEASKGEFSRDYDLRSQIRRASISFYIYYGQHCRGIWPAFRKEFANFINTAHGSATEVQPHLYLALDQGYIGKENFDVIYELMSEICRMLYALSQKLRN